MQVPPQPLQELRSLSSERRLDRKALHFKKLRTWWRTAEFHSLGMKSKLQLIDSAELEARLRLHSRPAAAIMSDCSLRRALARRLSVCLSYKRCFGQIAVRIV